MRTLKKTLSLVLVVAMVLGLCVVGASAKDAVENFTDDYQKVGAAYQEAMGVMVGVGIIDGMTETALEPQGTYTREQAAKIIAYMLLGKSKADSLGCTVAPFDDVAASRWSAGYIAFCVEQGIIDGMTATTYEPTGTLTGFQWAKMLLCAIGFGVKGEFTGSSWSVNTALVAHKVNLFAGDLDGADHTALRREQAALYAFNALNTQKVAYSPNVTSYVFGIGGYTTVNGIGSTLAKDVYDLKCATGIVVDVEGNGAGYTVLSKDYSTANVTDKIKADNDIDMMYHAANVWYTGTNTGVYTYDLAKTTTYKCQEIATGDKASVSAKATSGLYIGDNSKTAYEAYLIDNSAVSAGSAYVKLYASAGSMGYVDAAKKTTSVVDGKAYTVPSANVRTDISNIKYGAPVVYVYTTSTTDKTLHGLYVYPMTSTTGTVKSIAKENGAIVSVTLADGTVLKQSVLANNAGDREYYVIGNVYTFVLDSHGHVMYATKDYARTLWAYTGEWRATGNYGDINTDRGREYRFYNVTTGEEKFFPVRFVNRNDQEIGNIDEFIRPAYGSYFDISATAGSDGRYVAELITGGDNTYASGYIVSSATFRLKSISDTYYYWADNQVADGTLFFDGSTVTFLVATGTGANMKVNSYTGIAALKEAFGVAANGSVSLHNAAFTVTQTQTGHWNASTIFVMAANLSTESSYVFIPNDIASNAWREVSGDVSNYYVTYGGAYLEGTEISVTFDSRVITTDKLLVRGFYTMHVTYDRNGNPTYVLDQKMDNTENCFYQNVGFADTMVNGTWLLYSSIVPNKSFTAVEGTTKVLDLTSPNHGIASITDLFRYVMAHGKNSVDIAFTVNPDTKLVDYVYVTNAGWDAKYTFTLSDELLAAGWKIVDPSSTAEAPKYVTSYELNDEQATSVNRTGYKVTLYNANLAKEQTVATKYAMTLTENGAVTAGAIANAPLNNGAIDAVFNLSAFDHDSTKTYNYVIGGLSLGTVKFAANKGLAIYSGAENKNVVLGQSLTVQVKTSGNVQFKLPDQTVPSSTLYNWRGTVTNAANAGDKWTVIGTLNSNSTVVTFSFTPIHIDGTYNVGGVDFPLK